MINIQQEQNGHIDVKNVDVVKSIGVVIKKIMLKKNDIVLYNNEKYKIDNVRDNNGKEILKMYSIRGKS